jgi:uncharacterized membrane protein YphA (DoxX/SURF4 family)
MWLYNVSWKRAPDFGLSDGNGLYQFTRYAVDYPVFPPYSWVVENLILPLFVPFGWVVLLAETLLAVLLLTGTLVRFAAALGVVQSIAIGLSVAFAPNEWPWSYWLMIGAHALLLVSPGGRALAVDAVRAAMGSARRLGTVWGVASILMGAFSLVTSFADPLASRGPGLRSTDLSISLGEYNLIGAIVLIASGVALIAASREHLAKIGFLAAGLAGLAALSLYAQLGFSTPILGGTPTSAAWLLSIAVVGIAIARAPAVADSPSTATDSPSLNRRTP